METPRRALVGYDPPEDRPVPDDLAAWQGARQLVALLVDRYRLALLWDPSAPAPTRPGALVESRPRLLLWTAEAATFPTGRSPVEWRVSRLRTRDDVGGLVALVRLAGRDAAPTPDRGSGDVVELAVELRRQR